MQELNLPQYDIKVRVEAGTRKIFDPVRKKYLTLQPEEWVRQNFIQYLALDRGYPLSLISVERTLEIHGQRKRCDIVAFNTTAQPTMIVECKAPSVSVKQETFDQAARYNISLKVPYLVVTNGMQHFCCKIHHDKGTYEYLKEIPHYR